MAKKTEKYVISANEFSSVKEAEDKMDGWWTGGQEIKKKTKLYKITEIYDLKLRFVKRKK